MDRRGRRTHPHSPWSTAGFALALLAVVLPGCDGLKPGAASGPSFPGAPVILISIDTLRSDRLPAYGYREGSTPHLDAFRRDAILFERAYSHYPLTLPSHSSVLTGLLPTQHGVRDNVGYTLDTDKHPFLPRLLKAQGYATGGAVSSIVLESSTGIAGHFDHYDDDIQAQGRVFGLSSVQRPGPETFGKALQWVRSIDGANKPFFLFTHIYEPHSPYAPPPAFVGKGKDAYDGEIAAADDAVGKFLNELKTLGIYDRAVIVIFSDHGEGLGDHGEAEHGILLYREALQVPLLLKLPGQAEGGATARVGAQLIDIAPTVLALTQTPVPEGLPGTSLVSLLAPAAVERPIYGETYYPRLHAGWSELTSLIEGPHHYIHGPDPELFDLVEDPAQRNNLRETERRVAGTLRETLKSYWVDLAPPSEVDSEASAQLAALGYLSTPSLKSAKNLPDPRSKVHLLDLLQQGHVHLAQREDEKALVVLGRLLEQEASMPEAWISYGLALVHLGRLNEAISAYQKAIELGGPVPRLIVRLSSLYLATGRPKDAIAVLQATLDFGKRHPVVVRQLGVTLAEVGRAGEAIPLLQPLAAEGDVEAENALAVAYVRTGRNAEALRTLQAVLARFPDNAKALETWGGLALGSGDVNQARTLLEKAVASDPELSLAWNSLGVARQLQGQTPAALAAWQRALDLDPNLFDALFNQGLTAAAAGERRLAITALERFVRTAPPERFAPDITKARAVLARLGSG